MAVGGRDGRSVDRAASSTAGQMGGCTWLLCREASETNDEGRGAKAIGRGGCGRWGSGGEGEKIAREVGCASGVPRGGSVVMV